MVILPKLDRFIELVTDRRTPSPIFHRFWQDFATTLEGVLTSIQDNIDAIQAALDAANLAQAAADTAQTAADNAQAAADTANAAIAGLNIPPSGVVTVTSDYTFSLDDQTVLADATAGNVVITIPSAAAAVTVTVKKIDSTANTVTLDAPGTQQIRGSSTYVLSAQYDSITVTGDGNVEWL